MFFQVHSLGFCCGAEIVPKRSQCEQKPYQSYNLQCSLLIWNNHLPKTRFCCNFSSKCSDLILTVSETYPIRNVPHATAEQSRAVLFRSRKCFESSVPGVNRIHIQYTFRNAPFHYPVQCEHSLRHALLLTRHSSRWLRSKQKLNKSEVN